MARSCCSCSAECSGRGRPAARDLVLRRGNFTLYFPIGLMILLSVVGTIVLNIILRR